MRKIQQLHSYPEFWKYSNLVACQQVNDQSTLHNPLELFLAKAWKTSYDGGKNFRIVVVDYQRVNC
jgi:hypothetical protein